MKIIEFFNSSASKQGSSVFQKYTLKGENILSEQQRGVVAGITSGESGGNANIISSDDKETSILLPTSTSTLTSTMQPSESKPLLRTGEAQKHPFKLFFCAAGIFVCYFYFGIQQEKITRSKYGEKQETFHYTQSLVFVQCLVNALFALFFLRINRPPQDDTPSEMYAACSFSYLAAMIASNHALQFIPYPTQVLGKSCKPIPVMLMGVLFAHKRYPLRKYFFVLIIVIGCALFLYKDKKAGSTASPFQFGWGEMLLCLSLLMDGATGTIQERIKMNHSPKPLQWMFNMNLWSTLYLLVGLLVTGEIGIFMAFVQRHHHILFDMVSFSAASALGQYFIFMTVVDFGPLPCSIITTTRKFFTILFSVLFFMNPLNNRQWLGTGLVFTGLVLDMLKGRADKKPVVKD